MSALVNLCFKPVGKEFYWRKILNRKYQWKTGVYGHKPSPVKHQLASPISNNNELLALVNAYREHGHKKSKINPIALSSETYVPELDLNRYSLNLNKTCDFSGLFNSKSSGTVKEAIDILESTYCGNLTAEFSYLEDIHEREWFWKRLENIQNEVISNDKEIQICNALIKSQTFEKFLASKFVTLKRYSGEGAESFLACFLELFEIAANDGITDIIIAKHHRGRLSFITGLLNMPPQILFRKIKGKSELPEGLGLGDVSSHLCPPTTLTINDKLLNIKMANVPSHLEAVCPVSLGLARAIQQHLKEGDYEETKRGVWSDRVLNVQVHGDASLMGQGVSFESLVMSCVPNFNVGGSIHLIINNNLGFTTPATVGRGSRYASDIAKVISAPVIHVNGEYPNEVVKATRIAMEYQRKFRKNIFIDMNCFRRWGHNELDDPTYTNPLLYKIIREKSTVPDSYVSYLVKKRVINSTHAKEIENEYSSYLQKCMEECDTYEPPIMIQKEWNEYSQAPPAITTWDTGVEIDLLKFIGKKSVEYPESFDVHPNLLKNHINSRLTKIETDKLDWSTAETLAIGSLLYNGYNVRISGQDVGRGTFSHRHVMLVDQKSDDIFIPLNNLSSEQHGHLEIANSHLSEEAVLGFEYGFSTYLPTNLVIWEAQFGDFFNGAQIQIDTYISSGEDKWLSKSGIVLLLPHGYDGAGPEHSSCRLERFLQLANSSENSPDGENVNMHIINPTTPAQYFHALRRQMVRNYRKPLIVVAPKLILRSPEATSSLKDLKPNTQYSPVIGDNLEDKREIKKLIFVSGKHFYVLKQQRNQLNAIDTALIRLEELVPFPTFHLREEISKYPNAKQFIWSQEEHQNMGAWTYCKTRFENLIGIKLNYSGRAPSSTPAVGIGEIHKKEALHVIETPFKIK